ncbi:twin-arginine translocation signal domain-containing protein [Aggregatibacter actinomycetemcomitans]|uniref:twin-arginine translocation signal domain-containing protein n=1 Tax=Aggregatibacter actinomycetemcomitans TaxID=714 RepID=UPI001F11B1EF|nr:twin-arginine translocation signal domain-containing protein [Aggregatibacter actinomycetemcomitans]
MNNRRDFIKAGLALAAAASLSSPFAGAAEKTNIKTLVIVSHPYPERSVMIKGL